VEREEWKKDSRTVSSRGEREELKKTDGSPRVRKEIPNVGLLRATVKKIKHATNNAARSNRCRALKASSTVL
jgi:hypothetical protein